MRRNVHSYDIPEAPNTSRWFPDAAIIVSRSEQLEVVVEEMYDGDVCFDGVHRLREQMTLSYEVRHETGEELGSVTSSSYTCTCAESLRNQQCNHIFDENTSIRYQVVNIVRNPWSLIDQNHHAKVLEQINTHSIYLNKLSASP